MSETKIKSKEKKTEQKEQKITIMNLQIGTYLDKLNPICTLIFKDSTDKGFLFRTSNLDLTIRMNEEDYYSFIDTLISDVIDELQDKEEYSGYSIEDLQMYLITKINGEN